MPYLPENPLIVQSDRSLLLEVASPRFSAARLALAPFADLEKTPEHIHTYRLSPLSLWNAAACGLSADKILAVLGEFSRYDLPPNLVRDVRDHCARYGRLQILKDGDRLRLRADDSWLLEEVCSDRSVLPLVLEALNDREVAVAPAMRGPLKQALIGLGWPAEDLAGYAEGTPLQVEPRPEMQLRPYQVEAVEAFWADGSERGGSGVVVLPCGAGKTLVGIATMARAATRTLILCTNVASVHQWMRELLRWTTLDESQIGEYTGQLKQLRAVTLTTYQTLTWRRQDSDFPHFHVFDAENWGLVIYDEVHLLPAPVFRVTASLQGRRRLGLTATLIREDEREGEVFSLIGPKKFELPWKTLENEGFIATATCTEIRVALPDPFRLEYACVEPRQKFRVASENPAKIPIVEALVARHAGTGILVIGQFLEQLEQIAHRLRAPLITGKTSHSERDRLYEAFREQRIDCLVVSRVANFSIDLPEASVAIQVSGTFGSRQEEAQRLGRVLRPKSNGGPADFYSIVTRDTRDEEFAENRQLFLTEQGYTYKVVDADDLLAVAL